MRTPILTRCLLALPLVLAPAVTGAHPDETRHGGPAAGAHAGHKATMDKPAKAANSVDLDLKDLELLDQDGRPLKFVSDVIADKIVVMDFIYTTCTTVCPVLSGIMQQVQQRVGDDLGQDVRMVSMTVDAARDTPRRLKAHAAKWKARPGWWWLTGPEARVDSVLDGLGAYAPNFEDHPPMVLVGDGRTGEWSRFFGFPSPTRIMERVDALKRARDGTAGG